MRSVSLDNVVVVLVRTKHPGNIGSVARAMNNMGLRELRLAAPQCEISDEARRLARAGTGILEKARTYPSLEMAIQGLSLLVGTTGKTGGNREQVFSPRDLAPRIAASAAEGKPGILFGPEDTGLTDEDLLPCQLLLRIPTDAAARSINLAQAVMIVSYEVFLAQLSREPARVVKPAPVEQVEAMFAQFEQALLEIGFLHPQNAQHMMFAIRRILGRAGLEKQDVGILRGIARQIDWYARKGRNGSESGSGGDASPEGPEDDPELSGGWR
jgi:tRNA/rRNA methyltransferase